MTIEIPEDLAEFVQAEIGSGRFTSEQELLLAGLRMLRQDRIDSVTAIRDAWASAERGEGVPLDEADREVRRRLGLPNQS